LTEGIDVAASTTQGQEALPVTAGNGSPNLIYIRMDDRFPMSPGGGYSRFAISKITVTIAATVTWKLKNKSIIS
jgi:hypothetical protein